MAKLTTAAWIAHELGLAASFGGVLFGKLAMNPNLDVVDSKPDRGELLNKAWNRFNVVSAASTGTAIATWLVGRTAIKGSAIEDEARNLVLAKDALLAAVAVAGIASIISGLRLTGQAPEGAVPIDSGVTPAPETSEEAAGLLRTVNLLGNANLALLGGVIAVSTILSMKANESAKWALASRLLP